MKQLREPIVMTETLGKLIVFSGPAGAGKTSVLRELFRRRPGPLVSSVSATTRKPRPGEQEGIDYYFLSSEEFERRRLAGDFLECFEVFGLGYWYGTLRDEVAPRLAAGQWVVLEVDVDGAMEVLKQHPDAVTIFVRPSSLAELEARLRKRGTESDAVIQRRLEVARREWAMADRYQHQVVNEDVDDAVDEVCRILQNLGE